MYNNLFVISLSKTAQSVFLICSIVVCLFFKFISFKRSALFFFLLLYKVWSLLTSVCAIRVANVPEVCESTTESRSDRDSQEEGGRGDRVLGRVDSDQRGGGGSWVS